MSNSILQDKRGGECYLCKLLLGIDTPAASREEHHVMHGTANRRLSEHYGLKVYLCPYHHRTGPEAVHRCQRTDTALKEIAQRTFERKYGHEKWMEVFCRNYLSEEPGDLRRSAAGTEPDDRHGTWQYAGTPPLPVKISLLVKLIYHKIHQRDSAFWNCQNRIPGRRDHEDFKVCSAH